MHGLLCYNYNEMSNVEEDMKIALVDDDSAARDRLGALISAQLGGNVDTYERRHRAYLLCRLCRYRGIAFAV